MLSCDSRAYLSQLFILLTSRVWLVYPHDEEIEIYAPAQAMVKLTKDDELDGGTILPDFKLSLQTVFNS